MSNSIGQTGAGGIGEALPAIEGDAPTRRMVVGGAAFFGAVAAALGSQAIAQSGSTGSFSGSAMAMPAEASGPAAAVRRDVKIARAMLAGPRVITRDATVAEMDGHGNMTTILRQGSNGWICTPGDENRVGDPPMCVDELGMQWFKDVLARRPRPTNTSPGMCYMLCGATQHSNSDALDTTSPPIPIGPHWMVLWPFDAKHCGLPTTVRDAGAWIMFANTPYAYLHVCGTPWAGREYRPGDQAIWTMEYAERAG